MSRVQPAEHPPDELRLVEQAKAGDSDAFGHLYDVCIDRVYRYVLFRVADDETAEDLTAQVFLKAWENLHRFRPTGPLIAWLYSIARNTVIDHYRTSKQTVSLDEVAASLGHDARYDERLDRQSDVKSLREAMQRLTDEQREVLMMKFIEEVDTAEIARRTRRSEGAVRAVQMRALQALARAMKKMEGDGRERD